MHLRTLRSLSGGQFRGSRLAAITLLGVLVLTASPAVSRQVQGSAENVTAAQKVGTCSQQLVSQFNAVLSGVNSTAAITLAVQSAQFRQSLAGHGYTFDTIYSTDTYNPTTCSGVTLEVVAVSFDVDGVTVSSAGVTVPEGITVFENPQMTNVTSVEVDRDIRGFTYFSGWESYDGSPASIEYYSETIFNMPSSETWNSNCYHLSPYQCEMSPWDGLSNGPAGAGFLMQSGTDIKIPCTSGSSCSSPVLSAWWDCVNGSGCSQGAKGCGVTVYASDHIEAFVENGAYSGGNGNSADYEAFVQDATNYFLCGSGWQDMTSSSYPAAYWAQAIIEMPNAVPPATTGCCPIPINWGTLTFTSLLCPGTYSTSCIYYPSNYDSINQMYNYCTATGVNYYNINVGSYNSNNGQFTEQYNNNCDF
jgi:hypothetical protein